MQQINFTPLKMYVLPFKIFIWMKRIRMIIFRIILLAFIFFYFGLFPGDFSYSYSSSGSVSFPIFEVLFIWFGASYGMYFLMWLGWRKFARVNGFILENIQSIFASGLQITAVPSFKGKRLALSPPPIHGNMGQYGFMFFTRVYKEGGILRWRERKMDTVLRLRVECERMPHIVVNARANEKARLSNLSTKFPDDWKLQFEGVHGADYEVNVKPKDRTLALQLFTPDVLDVLYRHMPTMDVEVQGYNIWFIQRYGMADDKLTREIFTAAEDFMLEFSKQLQSARLLK